MSIDNMKIIAAPGTLMDNSQSVSLNVTGPDLLPEKGLTFEWKCRKYSKFDYSNMTINSN